MQLYFDKQGNIYRIEDVGKLKKKDHIDVYNEAGEEFGLPLTVADEFKLTEDEKAEVIAKVKKKILKLAKAIGLEAVVRPVLSWGCPNIDPPDVGAIAGTRINPQQQLIANLLKAALGGGCPNIDPADLGSILGTRIHQQQLAQAGLLRAILGGGCPNVDPVDLGSILGTRVNPQQQLIANLLKVALGGGCPNIDPPDYGSILGTRINPQQQLIANLLD